MSTKAMLLQLGQLEDLTLINLGDLDDAIIVKSYGV